MKYSRALAAAALACTGLLSCTSAHHTLKKGRFGGMEYRLEEQETKGPSTNSFTRRIGLGSLPPANITVHTTDWGPPYSFDLYGDAPYMLIEDPAPAYKNTRDNAEQHAKTMLYFPRDRFSRAEFDQYAAFLKAEWPAISKEYVANAYTDFPRIIGAVWGAQEDFVRVFGVERPEGAYEIRVEPDGRIRYYKVGRYSNDAYSGLSEKVEMPGKIIYLVTGKDAGLTLVELGQFTDKAGKGLADYFRVVER